MEGIAKTTVHINMLVMDFRLYLCCFSEGLGLVFLVFDTVQRSLEIDDLLVMYWIRSPSDVGGKSPQIWGL